MKITLIQGSYSPSETEELISKLMEVKINFHQTKISKDDEEETIKMRENRIIKLQNDIKSLREFIKNSDDNIIIEADIHLSKNV